MGKKKSIVLMVLLTIVIVVLCAITVVPSFTIPGTGKVKIWKPAVMQYDLGTDLDGGYYAYYYPQGIISEAEYKTNLEMLEAAVEAAAEGDKAEKEQELADYQADYVAHGGLYLSTDLETGILEDDKKTVKKDFIEAFDEVLAEIVSRYEQKNYADYRVSVVDDYAIRVQLPSSETSAENSAFQNISNTVALFSQTGELEIKMGDALVDERAEYEVNEIIKSFSVDTKYEVAYIKVKFTEVGKDMLKAYEDATGEDKLKITLGDETVMEITAADHIDGRYAVRYPVANESEIGYVETMAILLNSALEKGGYEIEFRDVASSEIRTFEPVYGGNTLTLLYIALAAVIVAVIVAAIVALGGFGVASAYSTVSYLIVAGLCFAFITGGVFEFSLGTVFVFVMGLALMNVLNAHVYNAIKTEIALGKTVESSVKGGYKKTIFGIVDIYAVLVLGAVALLIGAAGLHTLALQALICIVTGAFCNLLWTRIISYLLMSASKDKYKYFRCVREDDDDE
ncbi:MAG: hypothetical protein E7377_02720 [Clostridiales bacterium]|nr:hypothetical protein [Clostridiales bacterium]